MRGSLKIFKSRQGVRQWRAQWRENGSGRTRILGRCADMSRAEAQAELDRVVGNIRVKRGQSAAIDTVGRYAESEYLTLRSRYWKASTAATTESLVKLHIINEIGQRPLAAVTRKELQALLDAKAGIGLSYSVVAHIRWQLRALFKMAKSDGLIPTEPAESLIVPVKRETTDKRVITRDQILRAQLALEPRERLVFRLAVCEGMRPGEIVGLQVGDIRPDGIEVKRRVYRGKVDTPKSAKGRRLIPPTESTARLLAEWIELIGGTSEAWLFASENNETPVSYSNLFRRRIQPELEKVGLGSVNFQALRRTWVTEFSVIESDPHIRAQIAGHGVDVHENTYRQGRIAEMQRSMTRLGEHLQ